MQLLNHVARIGDVLNWKGVHLLIALTLIIPTGYADRDPIECHEAAMDQANRSSADISAVFDLANKGTAHFALLARCGDNKCPMDRLASACAYYCDATGTFAALIDNEYTSATYGDIYWSFVDLSTHCDSAELMARSGAWTNVAFFVEQMQQAAMEIEAKAIDF